MTITAETAQAALRTVLAAATSGDRTAVNALTALNAAAERVTLNALPGGERGREEARRRFGPLPGDWA